MLIDRTYFVGEINIPNVDQSAIGSLVDLFIQKYEPAFLQAALGYDLYKAFTAGIASATPEQKWKDLRDGVEYTDQQGNLTKWKGLITADPKESLIANNIYYWYSRNAHTQSTSMGEVKSSTENANMVSPGLKMTRAFNATYEWLCEMAQYLDARKDVYPEWAKQNRYCMEQKFRPTNTFNV